MKSFKDDQFKRSIIVAAHPDDEILWFSSIIERIHKIIVCYLNYQPDSQLNQGRTQSLSEYPLKNIVCLGLDESETFDRANWQDPKVTRYGIDISNKYCNIKKYIQNYHELKKKLSGELVHYQNVFTHNPWGEYGNEEHVQVYRVVKKLQESMSFNLWFTNYCSNKSIKLYTDYSSIIDKEHITLETNKKFAIKIKNIYQKNSCWTWYDDWDWLSEDVFISLSPNNSEPQTFGFSIPLNMIKVKLSCNKKRKQKNILTRIIQRFSIPLFKVLLDTKVFLCKTHWPLHHR